MLQVLCISERGIAYALPAFRFPLASRAARGVLMQQLLPISSEEAIARLIPVSFIIYTLYSLLYTLYSIIYNLYFIQAIARLIPVSSFDEVPPPAASSPKSKA